MWVLEGNVRAQRINQMEIAAAEKVVVGIDVLWTILQIIASKGSSKVNGCLTLTKAILPQSNIGMAQV